jgi:hypothetical protein
LGHVEAIFRRSTDAWLVPQTQVLNWSIRQKNRQKYRQINLKKYRQDFWSQGKVLLTFWRAVWGIISVGSIWVVWSISASLYIGWLLK